MSRRIKELAVNVAVVLPVLAVSYMAFGVSLAAAAPFVVAAFVAEAVV